MAEEERTGEATNYARPEYAEEIASLIKNTDSLKELREKLNDYHENDIADALRNGQSSIGA